MINGAAIEYHAAGGIAFDEECSQSVKVVAVLPPPASSPATIRSGRDASHDQNPAAAHGGKALGNVALPNICVRLMVDF